MGILSRIRAFWRRRIVHSAEHCIVDNRVFLLGLDKFYRDAVKQHERGELLSCARRVAQTLDVKPSPAPVEGYYTEDEQLTDYFRLMRGLQNVHAKRTPEVVALAEFQRLSNVTASPLYGRPQQTDKLLLPAGRDALSQALLDTSPEWTVPRLVAAADDAARARDDISLVGLAARCRDAVVLGALRESVVLYAEVQYLGIGPRREFVWQVDPELVRHANRFIEAFKALFGDELPAAVPNAAALYWQACEDNHIEGRCVRIGANATGSRHYHWGIFRGSDGVLRVQEFWHDEIWTTTRYRAAFRSRGRRPNL